MGKFEKNLPSGAKALIHSGHYTARLKSCPFKARPKLIDNRKSESREAEAAIDYEGLAGDEVRAGCKEEDGLGDIVRVAVAAHGSFGGETGCLKFRSAGSRLGKRWSDRR